MPKFSSLTSSYLRELSELFDELSRLTSPPAEPWVLMLTGIALSIEASFSQGLLLPLAAAGLGGALAAAAGKLRSWLSTTLLVTLFSAVVAAPAVLTGSGMQAALLVARAAGAAGVFTGAIAALGWYWVLVSLRQLKLDKVIAWELWLMLRMIPLQARDAARALTAREARLVVRGGSPARAVLASTVGDIILRSYRRARALSMAVEARTLNRKHETDPLVSPRRAPGTLILAVYTLLATILFLWGA